MQVICDENIVFTDVVAGWPGSVHDSRVLRNSAVSLTATNKSPGNTHLLSEGGHPVHTWLITPYRDNGHLTADETFFFPYIIFIALHKHKKLYKHTTVLKTILLTLPRVIETTKNT